MMDILYIIGLFVIVLALAYVCYRNFVSLDERFRKIELVLQGAQVVVRPPTPSSYIQSEAETETDVEAEETSVISNWGGQEEKSIKLQTMNDLDDEDTDQLRMKIESPVDAHAHADADADVDADADADVEFVEDLDKPHDHIDELSQLEEEFQIHSNSSTKGSNSQPYIVQSISQQKPGAKYIGITAIKTALQNAGVSFSKNAKKEDLLKLAEEHRIPL
jgi:hypothetical protein